MGYRDRAEFRARAAEYIADGLAQNQWVEYVGAGSRAQLRAELATMPGITDASDVKVTPVLEFYAVPAGSDIVDPHVAVATRVAAVEKAIDDGYTGFRAVVDATAMASRPEQRNALACFEFLIDQKMSVLPVSTLCAYDTSQLADDANGLICLHPYVDQSACTFRLYAEPDTGFALTGEIDAATSEVFATALRRTWDLTGEDTLVVDARRLEFIDHRSLCMLDQYARTMDRKVVLQTAQMLPARLADLLDLTNVRVESRQWLSTTPATR
ncbi:MEDS domain-containing protein [Mycobacterium sp.]|uniref:MEDS domain-containing protein n=1 Tax=Mycobacterium sp. TaxID=1785 RepID=UPI003D6A6624